MIKRATVLAVAGLCALATSVAVVPSAQAATAPSCTWTVAVPARYAIGPKTPKVTLTGSCASDPKNNGGPYNWFLRVHLGDASLGFQGCNHSQWYHNDPHPYSQCVNIDGGMIFTYTPTLSLKITTPGKFTTSGDPANYAWDCLTTGCVDTANYTLVPIATSLIAKYVTTTALKITRSGSKRSFTITPKHYAPSSRTYVNSVSSRVFLQRYVNNRWATYRTLSSTRCPIVWSGRFTRIYKWRVVTPATATRWSSTSTTTRI